MTFPLRIAVLGGQPESALAMQRWLTDAKFICQAFSHVSDFLQAGRLANFDGIVIEDAPADMPGIEVVNMLRGKLACDAPILMITHHDNEEDIVAALDAGVDHTMVKPLRVRELLARITSSCQRRPKRQNRLQKVPSAGPYELSSFGRCASLRGKRISLSAMEYTLAALLFSNPGIVLSREQIERTVWGRELLPTSRALPGMISRLRRVLNLRAENGVLLTVAYGRGYRLDVAEVRQSELPPQTTAPIRHAPVDASQRALHLP
ncbi:DNA-binding response regulator, OmpR family, contains REC and winged-helix (wHTH) domain [Cupriavidus sp. YR651]|uniref:response regulator transcription factor n=1 Tax=Cupriavidus sp. YR651 TaxID=1855315 RepID=UPI00088AC238|nr:response regulator transcription factor [Cupriavidus sp. YR651]SDD72720.1 DNA-binding response regulator, OmpR family, contains REC and winged-helix (wHTH) domain [Cupriavidus sp. YR651]